MLSNIFIWPRLAWFRAQVLHFSRKFSQLQCIFSKRHCRYAIKFHISPRLMLPCIVACKNIWTSIWFSWAEITLYFPSCCILLVFLGKYFYYRVCFVDIFLCLYSSVFSTEIQFFVGTSFFCDLIVMLFCLYQLGGSLFLQIFVKFYPDNCPTANDGSWTS